jgi:hypothetical protein
LLTALASEVRASQNILSGTRSPINDSKDGTEYGRVVVVSLPSVVAEETTRSALFSSERTNKLFKLAGHIQTHNAEVAFFQPTCTGFATGEALRLATEEMKQRQDTLRDGFEDWQRKIVAWRSEA